MMEKVARAEAAARRAEASAKRAEAAAKSAGAAPAQEVPVEDSSYSDTEDPEPDETPVE